MRQDCGPIDKFIALQIVTAREARGISQSALADKLGCAAQQVAKYEAARNRISSSTLFRIAHHLQKPISFFFPTQRTSSP